MDNDCDTFIDCFDEECFNVASCVDSCGKACVDKYPATSGAVCLKKEDFNPFSKSNRLIEGIEECTKKQEVCVCELSGCDDYCINFPDKLGSNKYKWITPSFRHPQSVENVDQTCYYNLKDKKDPNVYESFQKIKSDMFCCCHFCEKSETIVLKPSGWVEELIGWMVIELYDLPGKVETRVRRGDILDEVSDEKPYIYDRVMKILGSSDKKVLKSLFCDEVADYLIMKDSQPHRPIEKYGLYSAAILGFLVKTENEFKVDLINLKIFIGGAKKTDKDILPNAPPQYKDMFGTMISHIANYGATYILGPMYWYGANKELSQGCKLCWPIPKGKNVPSYFRQLSYFVFSDMIEGTMYGKGYAIEPHGLEFNKDIEFRYANEAYFYKKAEERLENCGVEISPEKQTFVIFPQGTNFSYENMSFSFPEGAVIEETNITITKIYYNCTEDYERIVAELYEITEEASLRDAMIAAKEYTEKPEKDPSLLSYAKMIVEKWILS